ncbi:MAG TPA: hypothetical protein VF478_03580 [Anaerolineae bacterium]
MANDSPALRALKAQPYFEMLGIDELTRLGHTVAEQLLSVS